MRKLTRLKKLKNWLTFLWSPSETLGSVTLLFERWGGESRWFVPGTTQYKFKCCLEGYLNRGLSKPSATPRSLLPTGSHQTLLSRCLPRACLRWTKKKKQNKNFKGQARLSWEGYALSWLIALENSMRMSHLSFVFLTLTCFHQEHSALSDVKIDSWMQTVLACSFQ